MAGRTLKSFSGIIIFLAFILQFATAQQKVAIITDHINQRELASLRKMVDSDLHISYRLLSIKDIVKTAGSHKLNLQFNHLWYHRTDTSNFDQQELAVGKIIREYVRNGGQLFLSMEAVPLLNAWQIEKTEIALQTDTVVDEGFGRPLGFHSFRGHPLFEGLQGGVYTSKQKKDHVVRKHGFFNDTLPASGKVVGIQWTYITFHENNKLLLEYKIGKGNIVAAGGYIYFDADNYNEQHLSKFIGNVLHYDGTPAKSATWWTYNDNKITQTSFSLSPIKIISASKWQLPNPSLQLSQHTASKDFYDLVGRRILWMGKMNNGTEEIWIHPFMALRDLEIGVKLKGVDSVSWLRNISPSAQITPEYLTRTYKIANSTVKEIYTVSFEHPQGVAHIEVEGNDVREISVRYSSNLRFMWPYTHRASGALHYSFNKNINGHIISGQNGNLNTIVNYSAVPVRQSTSADTALNQVKVTADFTLNTSGALNIYVTGSTDGVKAAASLFASQQAEMNKLFDKSTAYYKSLFNNHLVFETPDTLFNNGYRWALARTDQFLQTTPGIGTALMAGFGTTARGWDGAQKISGRPGYAWYFGRDGEWSSMAINAYGDFKMVKECLESYIRFQDVNGKIFHELTSSGVAHYDASDATPLFIVLMGHYLKYSGDIDYVRSRWPAIKKALDFCYSTDSDGDGLIENTNVGHGWIEGGKLFGTHTEFYLAGCWAATLDAIAYMSKALGLKETNRYAEDAAKVKAIIDQQFWNKQEQFFHNGKMIDGSFMPDATVLASVPVYLNTVTDTAKENLVSKRFASSQFSTDWGIRMIEEKNQKYKSNSYHAGMVWPLYGGWAALSEFHTGNFNSGYAHIINNLQVYRHWGLGSIEETLNGDVYKPNGVCSHQCWSETMVLQPAIEGMLGLQPDAMKNSLKLAPYFPWNWNFCKVSNIRMKDLLVQLDMQRNNQKTVYKLDANKTVHLSFAPAFALQTSIKKILVNGRESAIRIIKKPDGIRVQLDIDIAKGENTIEIFTEGGIGALPAITEPVIDAPSRGVKILSQRVEENSLYIIVEGRPGNTYSLNLWSAAKISDVKNGKITSQKDNVTSIEVKIPGETSSKGYGVQEVVISIPKTSL